jgi:hypothetical protein
MGRWSGSLFFRAQNLRNHYCLCWLVNTIFDTLESVNWKSICSAMYEFLYIYCAGIFVLVLSNLPFVFCRHVEVLVDNAFIPIL